MAIKESVTLYFREGKSDKVYQASIEESGNGFVVNFAYGRRGAAMQSGAKTPTAVSFEDAKKVYDRLVREKTGKGYTLGADGTPYSHTDKEPRASGVLPQLLNPIEESEAERYLADAAYWMQEKIDGRRVLVKKEGGEVVGINRKGLTIALPQPIVDHARSIKGDFIMDGEAVSDQVMAFDCLILGATKLSAHPYRDRWHALANLLEAKGNIRLLTTVSVTTEKRKLFKFLKESNREGVVFKRHDAPYVEGRPASGGPQVKLKFYATCSAIVARVSTQKRSVALHLFDGGKLVEVGNVTVPSNQRVPQAGSIVEIRYLYGYPGGALYQPTLLGVRDDIAKSACVTGQLKLKPQEADEDA